MDFLKRHWLGIALLLDVAWIALAVTYGTARDAQVPAILFWFLFVPWLIRGFIRFCGRAWRHGAKTGTSELR